MTPRLRTGIAAALFTVALALFAWQAIAVLPAELERGKIQTCMPLEPDPSWQVQPAKDFSLPDYAGRSIALSSFRGRVVFLNFWATWCPPCVDEMASLERLTEALSSRKDFALVTISEDKGWDDIRTFFPRGTQLTVLRDQDWRVAHEWGTQKLPESYLIDKQGNVRYYIINKRDWANPGALACLRSLLD